MLLCRRLGRLAGGRRRRPVHRLVPAMRLRPHLPPQEPPGALQELQTQEEQDERCAGAGAAGVWRPPRSPDYRRRRRPVAVAGLGGRRRRPGAADPGRLSATLSVLQHGRVPTAGRLLWGEPISYRVSRRLHQGRLEVVAHCLVGTRAGHGNLFSLD